MIEMIPVENEQLVAYRVEGSVTEEDFERVASALEDRMESGEPVRLYAEIASLKGMTMDALASNLAFGAKHATDIGKLDRAAVVAREDWIRTLVGIEDTVLPNVEMKAFPMQDKDRAMAWALA